MKIGLYIIFCMIICLSSCAYKSGTKKNKRSSSYNQLNSDLKANFNLLFGAKWELFEIKGKIIETNSSKRPFLKFENNDHKAFGNGGCNSFSVHYDIMDNDSIRFAEILSTKMACDNLLLEEEFFEILSNSGNVLINKDTLQLLDNSKILAKFKRITESK